MGVGGFSVTKIIMAASVVAVVGGAGYSAVTRYAAGTDEPAAPLIADEPAAEPAAAQKAVAPTPHETARAQTQALTQEVHALIEAEREIPKPSQQPTPAPLVVNVTGNGMGADSLESRILSGSSHVSSITGQAIAAGERIAPARGEFANSGLEADLELSANTARKVEAADRLVQSFLGSESAEIGLPADAPEHGRQTAIDSLREQMNALVRSDTTAD